MVFSDYMFIFGFMPVFFIGYYLLRPTFRNAYILVASLGFYYVGDKDGIVALLGAIVLNWGIGYLMGARNEDGTSQLLPRHRKAWLLVGLLGNLSVLIWYKYIGFFEQTAQQLSDALGLEQSFPFLGDIVLPLGISFFVFQGISYITDVYRGTIAPTHSLIKFGAYKSLFPQLIAGPIVRYHHVADALDHRTVTEQMVVAGITRFLIGFGKKVLLADTFAVTADAIWSMPPEQLSTSTAWLGTITYALQIYFDFSAYSDMAIGMAMMMGFRFPENFNYPYVSRSITEFWRRWHMTLGSWFRDYVYIPLGGNRRGGVRTYVNLAVVFVLTGLWHGAAWTFVVWGVWHGLFMVLERVTRFEERRIPAAVKWAGTMVVVLVGWVLFRAETFSQALVVLGHLVGIGETEGARELGEFWSPVLAVTLLVGLVVSAPVFRVVRDRLAPRWRVTVGWVLLGTVFLVASAKVLAGAYSPFLYFRF